MGARDKQRLASSYRKYTMHSEFFLDSATANHMQYGSVLFDGSRAELFSLSPPSQSESIVSFQIHNSVSFNNSMLCIPSYWHRIIQHSNKEIGAIVCVFEANNDRYTVHSLRPITFGRKTLKLEVMTPVPGTLGLGAHPPKWPPLPLG
jgi:hypothetical protein